MGRGAVALSRSDQVGPRATLTRRGGWAHPAPGGGAVTGRSTRRAADDERYARSAETVDGDRFGSSVERAPLIDTPRYA